MNSFLLKHLHHLIAADEQLVRVRNAIAGFENAEARLQAPGRGVVAFYSGQRALSDHLLHLPHQQRFSCGSGGRESRRVKTPKLSPIGVMTPKNRLILLESGGFSGYSGKYPYLQGHRKMVKSVNLNPEKSDETLL